MPTSTDNLIHIARIQPKGGNTHYLFLRKINDHYQWFEFNDKEQENELENEKKCDLKSPTIEEALQKGAQYWKKKDLSFRYLHCGTRFTLPERDEHGINALFYQMKASYKSINGVYFDEEVGHNCIVHNASFEALDLLKRFKS